MRKFKLSVLSFTFLFCLTLSASLLCLTGTSYADMGFSQYKKAKKEVGEAYEKDEMRRQKIFEGDAPDIDSDDLEKETEPEEWESDKFKDYKSRF